MGRWLQSLAGILFWLLVVAGAAWLLGLDDMVRDSLAAGHLLDWLMGIFCLFWLFVILKAPWDLYFQAHAVAFEQQRSRERSIALAAGREEYVRVLRRRLGWLAVGAHLFSAALVAAVTYFTGGVVGYYFAAFYVVSTAFRPIAAAYTYLAGRLRALAEESRYPREDVVTLRETTQSHDATLKHIEEEMRSLHHLLNEERRERDSETRDLRQRLHALSREFEVTVSRLTDNQDVIRGIQAFVRLVGQSNGSVTG